MEKHIPDYLLMTKSYQPFSLKSISPPSICKFQTFSLTSIFSKYRFAPPKYRGWGVIYIFSKSVFVKTFFVSYLQLRIFGCDLPKDLDRKYSGKI